MSAPPTSSPHPGVERKWDDLSAAVESLRDLRFSTLVHISALTNSVRSNSSRLRSHVQALDTGGLDPVADREVRRLMTLIPGVEQTLQPLNSKDWSSLVSQGGEDFWRGLDITFSDSQTALLSWISRERQTDNFELDRGNCYPPNTSVPPPRPARLEAIYQGISIQSTVATLTPRGRDGTEPQLIPDVDRHDTLYDLSPRRHNPPEVESPSRTDPPSQDDRTPDTPSSDSRPTKRPRTEGHTPARRPDSPGTS